jgi:hypothetical protein
MATAFGSRPFPWQDIPDIGPVRADGSIAATADLPPTRPAAPPLAVVGPTPEATETSWAPPSRRRRALLVGATLAAAVGGLAWIAWPRPAPAPDAKPVVDSPSAEAPVGDAKAPAPESDPAAGPPEVTPAPSPEPEATPEPTPDAKTARPRGSRRGSSRPRPKTESKTEPKAPSADKPEYDRLFDF